MRLLGFLAVLALAQPAAAETIVSEAPEAVSVTIYRDPTRKAGGSLDLQRLSGFAVLSEQRRIRLPAGEHELRFEGVANGMLAASAVIEGLPGGVLEKNRDARLLSPGSLVEAAVGGQATLVRTDPATGRERRLPVRLLSGPRGVLLQSADGVEALRCSALPERLVFDALPPGLSDRPTLSVRTRAEAPVEAVVTLSYLAQGFDWSANYVARLAEDGQTLALTGWVTLANANSVSFPDAPTQIAAGTVNRSSETDFFPTVRDPAFAEYAACWPWDTTATAAMKWAPQNYAPAPSAQPPPAMARAMMAQDEMLVATGAKLTQEEFADLKLYRTPEPTTIAANGQKQVLLLSQPKVPFQRLYRADLDGAAPRDSAAAQLLLRARNDAGGPLGQSLPAGQVAVFETALGRSLLLGEDAVRDTALGERLDIALGASPDVRFEVEAEHERRRRVRLSNATAAPVTVEVRLNLALVRKSSRRFQREDGYAIWRVSVPAGGSEAFTLYLANV